METFPGNGEESGTLYFEIHHDFPQSGRWYLGDVLNGPGRVVDTGIFFHGVAIDPWPPVLLPMVGGMEMVEANLPLQISVDVAGPALDFTLGAFDLPIVTTAVADLLASVAPTDFQRLPVRVKGCDGSYEIINISSQVACIDTERSEIDWWPTSKRGSANRPKPRAIFKLFVDPSRACGHHLFRLSGWEGAVIISDVLKTLLERAKVSGIKFAPV